MKQDFKRNNPRKAYRMVDAFKKGYTLKSSFCRNRDGSLITKRKEVYERWRDCFEHLFNPNQAQVTAQSIELEREEEDPIDPPTMEKIKRAVRKLKNNKAPRVNSIPRELIKYGGEVLVTKLYELFIKI